MKTNIGSQSTVRPPSIEHNSNHVYIRYNYQLSEIEGSQTWTYDEIYLSDNEYNQVQAGSWVGPWNDALRGVERERLYDHADKMISKYSTDAEDSEKRAAWVAYKGIVRSTQSQPTYPETVVYPQFPE